MRKLMFVLMLLCLVGVAHAEPLLTVPGLSLSGVAGTGGNAGIGGCLSYALLQADNGSVYADLGLLVDGSTYDGFFGLSTDKPVFLLKPIIENLPGDAALGVGWCEPTSTWLFYLRYDLFGG